MNELARDDWTSTSSVVFDPAIGLCVLNLRKVDSSCIKKKKPKPEIINIKWFSSTK